ncbi:hypothetical protein [Mucilaginibacter ginsenosidivorans]|uniref:DUF4142 domain-containing protein n=1 Tax=Mucilaginibacter ginsenosidivorans TaxID=398053 RepID=A0A5B8V488_9SPHI|nr:hypothetical protein [Mucilaginibacter ginsenosidivorans]QEC65396.1 hypothetical protein FRZ54_23420 [Mucilaginibacter ginsenosidivorans]
MIKRLPLFILLLFFSPAAFAQSDSDSTKHPSPDTTAKKVVVDSISKIPAADTTAKAVKDLKADSASASHAADSVAKQVSGKQGPARKIKHARVDSVAKALPGKTAKSSAGANTTMHSTVKTLSDERYSMLMKGEDFDNMSLAGELNHYPMPDKALEYKVQLGLNPGQLTKLKEISAVLHRKRIEMGENIIKNEKMLDTIFQSKQAVDGTVIFYTNRYGLYMGEIRNAVLQACLKTRDVLSEAQISKLESLEKAVK